MAAKIGNMEPTANNKLNHPRNKSYRTTERGFCDSFTFGN